MHISSNLITENLVNPLNFTNISTNVSTLQDLTTNKSYTPISTCVLEHILINTNLCDIEKLFYLLADSVSLIRHNKGHRRNITLSAKQWATKLDCSIAEIFAMQQSLEEKGYFEILRSRNKSGKNMKNVITTTLPDSVFNLLANTPNRFNIGAYSDTSSSSNLTSSAYMPRLEDKREYLDRTKMFIKLNYDLLSLMTSYKHLAKYSKVIWLGLYATGYRYYLKHRDCSNNATDLDNIDILDNIHASDGTNYYDSYSLTTTYKELQDKYSCSKSVISKTLKELETLGFITRNRFFVKNDDEDDNLHDKSIWRITVTVPCSIRDELIRTKDRSQAALGKVIFNSDPYVANSSQYINKYLESNIKDLDSIDRKESFIKKNDSFSSKTLSVSYKNSIQEKEESCQIFHQIETTDIELPNNPSSEENKIDKDEVLTITVEQSTYPVEIEESPIVNTNPTINPNKNINPSQNIADRTEIKIDNANLTKIVKFSPNATLKDWYPLLAEDVDRLNSKSDREFSSNFVNQLLLKLDSKYPGRIFPTKNHLISYMTTVLRRELHQAPMVNHQTFRFDRNDQESMLERQREKYLSEVEYSIDTSYYSQLRRKIAALFEPKLAYQLLTTIKFTTTVQEQRSSNNYFDDQYLETEPTVIMQEEDALLDDTLDKQQPDIIQNIQDHSFTVKLNQEIPLSDLQQQILENAIVSVYGHVDITYQQVHDNYRKLDKLQPRQQYEIYLEELDPNSAWYKVRRQLKDQFGDSIDKAWFSKLTAEENLEIKTLTLLAPSNFIKDYIYNKYKSLIEQFAGKLSYQVVELATKKHVEFAA